MGLSNPFEIIIVITGVILLTVGSFAIIAPSLVTTTTDKYGIAHQTIYGADVPQQPILPQLANINSQGNLTRLAEGGWAFDESHDVNLGESVTYSTFNPVRYVTEIHYELTGLWSPIISVESWIAGFTDAYKIVRDPWPGWGQPVWFADGSQVRKTLFDAAVITPQDVIDNANTTSTSFFIIDKDNADGYSAYMEFTPVSGASTLEESWNSYHSFTIRLMGNDYAAPSWVDQAGAFLSWLANMIGFVVQYIWYLTQMSALLIVIITGISTVLAASIVVLILGAFIGAVLMYLRGSQDK